MNTDSDTIAAIATAPGEAGISIVRVSGARSLEIADGVFQGHTPPPSQRAGGTFFHGRVTQADGHAVDEVVLLLYRAPHSYTREDVVEFQGHGGRVSAKRILRRVLEAGARLAEPGEFSKRAFLNGRIDLTQAEAVADLISAQSDRAADAAMEQLSGDLSRSLAELYDELMSAAVDLESTLDLTDDELPDGVLRGIEERLSECAKQAEALLTTWEEGHLLREGARVVISGRPNVGKSTLMNTLLGVNRSIVAPVPGTTRDTVEEALVLDGIPLRLVDTAGLRESGCEVEQEGVRRARESVERADLVLHVLDASRGMEEQDRMELGRLRGGRCIVVLNKADLAARIDPAEIDGFAWVSTSARDGAGVDELRQRMATTLGGNRSVVPHASISERHRQSIQNALNDMNRSVSCAKAADDSGIVLAAIDVRSAAVHIGSITGRVYTSELLDGIFSRFCVGK